MRALPVSYIATLVSDPQSLSISRVYQRRLRPAPAQMGHSLQGPLAPLALTTAWVGFYNAIPNGLGFDAPVSAAARGKYRDTPIIVIGGASSVGQLSE